VFAPIIQLAVVWGLTKFLGRVELSLSIHFGIGNHFTYLISSPH
jgi:hypothetical protein